MRSSLACSSGSLLSMIRVPGACAEFGGWVYSSDGTTAACRATLGLAVLSEEVLVRFHTAMSLARVPSAGAAPKSSALWKYSVPPAAVSYPEAGDVAGWMENATPPSVAVIAGSEQG